MFRLSTLLEIIVWRCITAIWEPKKMLLCIQLFFKEWLLVRTIIFKMELSKPKFDKENHTQNNHHQITFFSSPAAAKMC